MNPSELLKSVSSKLNLKYETQDWGIINADPNRFEEFLSFYKQNQNLYLTQKYHLCELIIASFNEAMIERNVVDNDLDEFRNFISKIKHAHGELIEYWTSLYESDEFPVAKILHGIAKNSK